MKTWLFGGMIGGRRTTYYNSDDLIVDQDDYDKFMIFGQDDLEQ